MSQLTVPLSRISPTEYRMSNSVWGYVKQYRLFSSCCGEGRVTLTLILKCVVIRWVVENHCCSNSLLLDC